MEGLFPNVTRVSPVKPVPVRVTVTPPDEGPAEGVTAVRVVPATNRYPRVRVDEPPAVVTITSANPAAWPGVFTVSSVPSDEAESTTAGAPPKVTWASAVSAVPTKVTGVATNGPDPGSTKDSLGAAT